MIGRSSLSRRALLHGTLLTVGATTVVSLLAACGAGTSAATTSAPAASSNSAANASVATASNARVAKAATSSSAPVKAGTGPNATATAKAVIPKVAAGALLFSTYGSADEGKVWDQAIAAFSKSHPDITVQHDTPSGFYDKVLVEAAAGTPSDLMMFETKRMPNYITQSLFLALDRYVATSKITQEHHVSTAVRPEG